MGAFPPPPPPPMPPTILPQQRERWIRRNHADYWIDTEKDIDDLVKRRTRNRLTPLIILLVAVAIITLGIHLWLKQQNSKKNLKAEPQRSELKSNVEDRDQGTQKSRSSEKRQENGKYQQVFPFPVGRGIFFGPPFGR